MNYALKRVDIFNFVSIPAVRLIDNKRLFDGQAGGSAPGAFDQDHIRLPVGVGVDEPHAFGLDPVLPHQKKDVDEAEGPVDEVAASVGTQDLRRFPNDVVEGAFDLVPRNGLCALGICQSVPADHVRRVARHDIKRGGSVTFRSLPDISAVYCNFSGQTVQTDAPVRHFSHFRLDLETRKGSPFRLRRKKQGDDPVSGPEVDGPFPGLHRGKAREEDGVHAEAELSRILDDLQAVPLQVVYSLGFP